VVREGRTPLRLPLLFTAIDCVLMFRVWSWTHDGLTDNERYDAHVRQTWRAEARKWI